MFRAEKIKKNYCRRVAIKVSQCVICECFSRGIHLISQDICTFIFSNFTFSIAFKWWILREKRVLLRFLPTQIFIIKADEENKSHTISQSGLNTSWFIRFIPDHFVHWILKGRDFSSICKNNVIFGKLHKICVLNYCTFAPDSYFQFWQSEGLFWKGKCNGMKRCCLQLSQD